MKGKKLALLAAVLALCVSGCARADSPPADPAASFPAAETPVSSGSAPGPSASPAGRPAGELTFHNNPDGAAAGDGFYYLRPGEGAGSVLCRLDFASGQSAPVCAVPGCEHGGDECPAYFSCYANLPVPVLWQGRLVLIFPGNPFAGEPGDEAYLPRIELAETDGTGRRELVRLAPEEQIAVGVATDDNRLYFLTSPVERQTCQPAWTLKSVDLSTGQTVDLARYGGESMAVGYYLTGCTEEGLVIKRIETTGELEPSEESVASNVHSLMLVDRQNGVPRPLKQWRQDEIAECVSDGQLFYCDGEGRLFRSALDGTEDRLAAQLPAAVQPKNIAFGADCAPWLSITGRDDAGSTFRWLCNTRTGEVADWSGSSGSDRLLVSLGPEWSVLSNTPPGAGQTRRERIATADLLAGSREFLPVD